MLKEIRKQPDHIRAIFMWLSVFIFFSAVVFIWANSFQQKLVFMLESDQEKKAATENGSPFAIVGSSAGDLKAAIFDLFGLAGGTKEQKEAMDNMEERSGIKIEPRLLPVSE